MNQLWVFTIAQIGTVAASTAFAALIALLLPKLPFGNDAPLPRYSKRWALWAALIAIPVSYGLTFLESRGTGIGLIISIVFIAGIGSVFVCTDQAFRRVPNMPMAILYAGVAIGLILDAIITGNWIGLLWSFVGFLATALWFFISYLMKMGMGDLKLFAIVAAPIAYVSGTATMAWILTGYVVAAVYGIVLLINGAGRKGQMPMAPPMILTLALLPAIIAAGAFVIQ